MKTRLLSVLATLGLLSLIASGLDLAQGRVPLPLARVAQAAGCPPEVVFGCILTGSGAHGWRVNNNTRAIDAAAIVGQITSTSPGTRSAGVLGINNGTTAEGYGIYGSHAGGGHGVLGKSISGKGVYGAATSGTGVYGRHTATSGAAPGVQGDTGSTAVGAAGVLGKVTTRSAAEQSAGIRGINAGTGASGNGVWGSHAGSGWGVWGTNGLGHQGGLATDTAGAYGEAGAGIGVLGRHIAGTGTNPGVQGETSSTAANAAGVLGQVTSTSPGSSSSGVRGINAGTGTVGVGVWGSHAGGGWGVYGTNARGFQGALATHDGGVYGKNRDYDEGWLATNGAGVWGRKGAYGNIGALGMEHYGVYGFLYHSNLAAVYGEANNGNNVFAIMGRSGTGWAGYFDGKTRVNGNFSVSNGSKNFVIDHPLDPANKELHHAAVESSERINVYNGNATLDANGEAWVDLPAWFEALNGDFRYQLTAIGAPGPNLYIAEKIENNRFKIAGGVAGMEVSWLVTGTRRDAWAAANPFQVEVPKAGVERGFYLSPDVYGQPEEKGIEWATHGEAMREMRARRQAPPAPAADQVP